MVAAAGAGPKPIPQKSLNSENLTEAITFCLTPEASVAADGIASKMKSEAGVAQAVKSFHTNLPLDRLRCDILPDQVAVWTCKIKGRHLKLSKIAAEVLIDHAKLERKRLNL